MINSLLQAVPRRVAVHQRLDRWLPMSLLLHIRGSFAKHTRYSTSYASSNRRFYTERKMNHKVARYIIHYIGTTLAAVTDDFFTFAHMRHYVNRTETALGARTCTGAPIHVVCRSSTRQNPYSHVSSLHISHCATGALMSTPRRGVGYKALYTLRTTTTWLRTRTTIRRYVSRFPTARGLRRR